MAQIKDPLGGTWDAKKVGGIIQVTQGGRMTARSKTGNLGQPVKENLRLQVLLNQVFQAWLDLTDEERSLWYACKDYWTNRLDYTYPNRITSLNWFTLINFRLVNAGLDMITVAPAEINPANVSAFDAAQGDGFEIDCTWTATSDRFMLEIFSEPTRHVQRTPFYKFARFRARAEGDAGAHTITSPRAGYVNIHYSTLDKQTGLVSDFQSFEVELT